MIEPIEQTFVIPLPPSVNALYRNVPGIGRVKTAAYRRWQTEAGWMIKACFPKHMSGGIKLEIRAVRPDNRRRDLGNLEKAVSDLLVALHVIEDDRLIESIMMSWVSSDLAGVSVTVTQVPRAVPVARLVKAVP